MSPKDRMLWIDLMTSRYLTAFEADDFAAQAALWKLAEGDAELANAFHETHLGLIEEREAVGAAAVKHAVKAAMPSVRIDRDAQGPVTAAEVLAEVLATTPGKLDAEGHRWIAQLHGKAVPVPEIKGLAKLRQWIETEFGTPPPRVAEVFQTALQDLRLRRLSADPEVALAARKAAVPRPEGAQ